MNSSIIEDIKMPSKNSWYQLLKTDPIIFNVYKEYAKQKYLQRKTNGSNQGDKSTNKSPEEKARYRQNYYNTHKDKLREYQRSYYHKKIKGSAKLAARKNKELTPEARQRKQEYQRRYSEKTKELVKFAKQVKEKQEPDN